MSETGATAGRQNSTTQSPPRSGAAENDTNSPSVFERTMKQLRGNPLVVVLVAAAASIAIVAALFMWASSPDYRVLYSNLSEADGGRIITELDTRGVPYQFSQGGQALLVPSDQVHTLRLQLAEQGLPQGGNLGLELMETQAFGISQFAEQVNFQRGLEGELARSIESLGPVERVRVHLSMAKPSVFIRDREPAKASVVLTLLPGRVLGEGQVSAIVHMVSSSVPELAIEDVTVVDQNGRLLTANSAQGNDLDGTQLAYITEVERSYQQRIENILSPIMGSDNVRAQVAAQIDFSRREQTSERYSPNQAPNESAVRSRQLSLSYDGEDPLATGIPGALSNTPPGVAPSPINQPDAEEGDGNDDAEPGALRNLRQEDVVNYEVDRSIEHVQHRLGQVQRLSAAVVVNFRRVTNEEGEVEQVALSAEEIAQIERLVQQAMGFSELRGDQVEVVNTPFAADDETRIETVWWQHPDNIAMATTLGRYLLVAIAALLLYWLILRPLIKRYTQPPVMAAAMPGGTLSTRIGDEEDEQESESDGDEEDTYSSKPKRRRKTSLYEHNLNDLREMAQEDPRMVAMIIRSWMNAND
ncbi:MULTISPECIES: flagellar basal-body MS-ring/collar protein FliF [unclassified Halomonas]|uniref:flagellar basal-body MS-ring/collar protein FliF n=1 Tax=unclassified Halomonas TaxID=2609666 RepID=UPI001EF59AD0|nr:MULTISPECIES: flagellar basal-body MS-ring/collar protein FliF [unclassified Halomonas]MCG7576851.1 flagellar M-ring protein FliF [Halomonas sp. MMH1-48]MCG7603914.1 flagellar M-ring protein FliF [Halomonas sp. MM17-34]MCG7613278.1 flagellar M-ring protein FliF [Halomonas sp. MM17-29]MCG7620053.1 flagellar M-ring protein FliF [Halomonas sp. DSH1-27]